MDGTWFAMIMMTLRDVVVQWGNNQVVSLYKVFGEFGAKRAAKVFVVGKNPTTQLLGLTIQCK